MASNVEFVGLTKLGEDVVRGLQKIEDPNYVYLLGDEKFFLKKWSGMLGGERVVVMENIQVTYRDDSGKIFLYSNLIVRGQDEYQTGNWQANPFHDNTVKKHDKTTGNYKF